MTHLQRHHRRSIRLQGYGDGQAGAYFVTICTKNRGSLFGTIVAGENRLNDAGCIVTDVWDKLPAHYAGVETDAFVVIPNHVHGIVILTERDKHVVGAGFKPAPTMDGRWARCGTSETGWV
jgi:putative transposase